jgi:hypothetical protein
VGRGAIVFIGLGTLLVVVGVMVLLTRRRSAAKQAASLTWPTCDGQVTRAVVQTTRDKDDVTYSADIAYAYAVNGQSLSADRVAWGGRASSSNARDAEAVVARYPVGAAVRVCYNPDKPAEAVLEPRATGGLRTMMIVAVSFMAVGAIFIAIGPFVQD